MSREKQIEEMQNELCINCNQLMRCSDGVKSGCRLMKVVDILYNAGYRKQSEVVRCKDCKHYQYDAIFLQGWCNGRKVEKDDFCSYGEMKGGEG